MKTGLEIFTKRRIVEGLALAAGGAALFSTAACGPTAVIPRTVAHENSRYCGFGDCDAFARTGVVVSVNAAGDMEVDTCAPKNPPLDDYSDELASYFTDATLAQVKSLGGPSKCHFEIPAGPEGTGGVSTEWISAQVAKHNESVIGTVIAYDNPKPEWSIAGHIS